MAKKPRITAMEEKLNAEPKQSVYIPLIEGSGETTVECCINGYNLIIKRGENVELPASVISLLKTAGII